MRTTISLDARLARLVKQGAAAKGLSVSAFIAEALRDVLTREEDEPDAPPFRLITIGQGATPPSVDLDRTSAHLVAEDEAQYRPGSR